MNNTNNIAYAYSNSEDIKIDKFVRYATMYMSAEQIDKTIRLLTQAKTAKEKQNEIVYFACNYPT